MCFLSFARSSILRLAFMSVIEQKGVFVRLYKHILSFFWPFGQMRCFYVERGQISGLICIFCVIE